MKAEEVAGWRIILKWERNLQFKTIHTHHAT